MKTISKLLDVNLFECNAMLKIKKAEIWRYTYIY